MRSLFLTLYAHAMQTKLPNKMTMQGEYRRRIKISNYSETASRYISENRRRRGASENEELP